MKTFHKQFVILLVLFAAVFVPAFYFAMWTVDSAINDLTEKSTGLLVWHFDNVVSGALAEVNAQDGLSRSQHFELRQALVGEFRKLDLVKNVLLIDGEGNVQFSFNPILAGTKYPLDPAASKAIREHDLDFKVQQSGAVGMLDAIWPIAGTEGLQAVLALDAVSGELGSIVRLFKNQFIVIGAAGFVGALFLSVVATGLIKTPLRNVDKALTAIDEGEVGFRLRTSQNKEFRNLYDKLNHALARLETTHQLEESVVENKSALQQQLERQERFLRILSHELRNPLYALTINLDVLKTKIKKNQPRESTLKYADMVEREMNHLQELIQGFLAYVRPGTPKKERTDLNDIIKNVCQLVATEAEKSQIKIETRLRDLPDVLIDRNQFQQALHNIVINAIHATSQNGNVSIRSTQKRKNVTVSVHDTGAGMTKEEVAKAFDLFYTTKKGGSGIGLPVTQRMIEANGGHVRLESTVGKGTTVTLTFPSA